MKKNSKTKITRLKSLSMFEKKCLSKTFPTAELGCCKKQQFKSYAVGQVRK